MKRTIVITVLTILCTNPLWGMEAVVVEEKKAEKELAAGLALLALGEKETALKFFLQAAANGNAQERDNALICIRAMADSKVDNASKDFGSNQQLAAPMKPNSNNAPIGADIDELLRRNEEEIKRVTEQIATAKLQHESDKKKETELVEHVKHMKYRATQRRHGERKNNDVQAAEQKLNSVKQACQSSQEVLNSGQVVLRALQKEKWELLEKAGPGHPRYQEYQEKCRNDEATKALLATRAVERATNLDAKKMIEEDKKAFGTVEAKYYIVDGRCCVTAGRVPNKELEYVGLAEEQRRISHGQHMREARWQEGAFITSGYVPDSWGPRSTAFNSPGYIYETDRREKFLLWCKMIGSKKNEDDKTLLEVQIQQAKQAVEEKALTAEKVNHFYFKALAGKTDQQGIDRLRAETERASAALQHAREEVARLTAKLLKLQ